jgi:hypothetical protein
MVDGIWYVGKADIHRDLRMEIFWNEMGNFSKNHEENILHHVNFEAIQLLENSELCEILKINFFGGVYILYIYIFINLTKKGLLYFTVIRRNVEVPNTYKCLLYKYFRGD